MQWPLYGTRLRADSGVAACFGALTTSIGTQPRRQPPVAGILLAGSGASRLADGPLFLSRPGQVRSDSQLRRSKCSLRSGHAQATGSLLGRSLGPHMRAKRKKKRSRANRTKVSKTKREMSSKLKGDRGSGGGDSEIRAGADGAGYNETEAHWQSPSSTNPQ